jgi:limonene-1,2-epoxide hydrolase
MPSRGGLEIGDGHDVFHAYGDNEIRGRDAVLNVWKGVFGSFGQIKFETVHQAVNGDIVIAEQVHGLGLPGRHLARVMNMAIYEIRDGKNAAWRDYTNPRTSRHSSTADGAVGDELGDAAGVLDRLSGGLVGDGHHHPSAVVWENAGRTPGADPHTRAYDRPLWTKCGRAVALTVAAWAITAVGASSPSEAAGNSPGRRASILPRRKLAIGLGGIAVDRTMGAHCFRSGSWRGSDRLQV